MYAVIFHLLTLRWMPDHVENLLTRSRRAIMPSIEVVMRVPLLAYHLLASYKPQEAML